jgi:hypothetical protein
MSLLLALITATACPAPKTSAACKGVTCEWNAEDESRVAELHDLCRQLGPNYCAGVITKVAADGRYTVVCRPVTKT